MENDNSMRFVKFENYCSECEHKALDSVKDPCNEFLKAGARITKEMIEEAIKKLHKIPVYDWREVNFDRYCMSCKHVGNSLGFECAQCERFVMLIGTDVPIAYQPKSLL